MYNHTQVKMVLAPTAVNYFEKSTLNKNVMFVIELRTAATYLPPYYYPPSQKKKSSQTKASGLFDYVNTCYTYRSA